MSLLHQHWCHHCWRLVSGPSVIGGVVLNWCPEKSHRNNKTPEGAVSCVSSVWGSGTAESLCHRVQRAWGCGAPSQALLRSVGRGGRRRQAHAWQRPTRARRQHRPRLWSGRCLLGRFDQPLGTADPSVQLARAAGTHSCRPQRTCSLGRGAHF